jgi:hypothetical protein
MPKDALLNSSAPLVALSGPHRRVSGMQAKLHQWAAADPGRRFDDLFNLVRCRTAPSASSAWATASPASATLNASSHEEVSSSADLSLARSSSKIVCNAAPGRREQVDAAKQRLP